MTPAPPVDIARLMRPRSIAIVGISPQPGSPGAGVLDNLVRFGFGGDIHLVSRSNAEVKGRRCVAAIGELPEGVDAALLTVPRAAIEEAVAECVRRRVGAVMIFAAGFAEAGGEWKAAQDRIAALARNAGIALSGPNCLGIVNYVDGVPLTFSPQGQAAAPAGPGVAVVAQSGGLASMIRSGLLARKVPVSYTISTGNEAGLALEDYLVFAIDDTATRVVALFAEQLRKPQRFLGLAAQARGAGKAIVLLHPGRSAAARASALSHTGALAGDYAVMRALTTRAGVIMVDGLDELIDVTELMARFPVPPAAGAAVLTDSGAFKSLALDLCEALGLDLPPLSEATTAALKRELPEFIEPSNPADLTAQGILDTGLYGRVLRPLMADANFGSILVASLVSSNPEFAAVKINAVIEGMRGAGKPAILSLLGGEGPLPEAAIDAARDAGIPVLRSAERGLRALALITAHGRTMGTRRTPAPPRPAPPLAGAGVLPEYVSKAYLAGLGVPVPEGGLARDIAEARATAARIGYPVALKLQAAALPHKSDAGAVRLGIADTAALDKDWRAMHAAVRARHPDIAIDGVLVEAMAGPGLEMIVGARRDADWGPVIAVGLGGIWAEALRDVLVLAPDLDRGEIAAALGTLKTAPLLAGVRGEAPRDVDALLDVVEAIGALVRVREEIAEIEINPLRLFARGKGALALDALIVTNP